MSLKLLLLIFIFLQSSVSGSELYVVGSTTAMPLAEECAKKFSEIRPNCSVNVCGGGSTIGLDGIVENGYDIAMSSRQITDEELLKYETVEKRFNEYLVGYDGICVVLSERVYDEGVTKLSIEQLRQIYSNEIRNWKDIDGPDHEIYFLSRKPGSGTRVIFDQFIMGLKNADYTDLGSEIGGNAEVVSLVADSNWAIGYVGYSYVEDNGMMFIPLDGVAPTLDNITCGSYPLARNLYFYTFGFPTPCADAFIKFVTGTEGQKIAEDIGIAPITPL